MTMWSGQLREKYLNNRTDLKEQKILMADFHFSWNQFEYSTLTNTCLRIKCYGKALT